MTPDDDVDLAETETGDPAETAAKPAAKPAPAAPAKPAAPAAKPAPAGPRTTPAAPADGDPTAPEKGPAAKPVDVPSPPSERSLMDGVDDEAETVDDDAETLNETAGKIPDDWREQLAGGDATRLKALKRFGSMKSWANSWFQQRDIITKGKQDSPLPEDASDEDKAAWRKSHDVPDDPSGYTIEAPKGVEWDAEDKKYIDAYAKYALDNGMSRAEVKRNAEWFINEQIAKLQDSAVETRKALALANREIKAEFGTNSKQLSNRAQAFGRSELGAEEWDALEFTKLANGTVLGDSPTFIRSMIALSEKYFETSEPFEAGSNMAGEVSDSSFKAKHLELVAKRAAGDADAKKTLANPAHEKRLQAIYEREEGSANRRLAKASK